MASTDAKKFWNDNESEGPRSTVGLLQLYSDKIATTMKRGAFVMYPVHVVLLNFTAEFRRHLIDSDRTLLGFLHLNLKTYWKILKVPITLETVTVGLYGLHLRWYRWKMLFLRRRYGKNVGRNCVFFIRPLIPCSTVFSSPNMRDTWLLHRMGEGGLCCIVLFLHFRGRNHARCSK